MAEQTKVELTKSKLDLEGVQVTLTVRIGDWTKYVAISPIDYKAFKQWSEIYSGRVIKSVVDTIEHELKAKDFSQLSKSNNKEQR